MTQKLEQQDWKKLIRDFDNHRVVLLLGRSLAKAKYKDELLPIGEIFALHLSDLLVEDEVEFDETHKRHLSYIAQKFVAQKQNRRTDLEDEIAVAYEEYAKEVPPIYHQLAKLPFLLIINTTPDDFMVQALREVGKNPDLQWYDFHKNQDPQIGKISEDTPLVYNIFGSLEDPESLMITERDRMDFFRNIIKDEPPVPPKILSQLDGRTTYLFYEFNLDEWPFRLLFGGLNLQENSRSVTPKHEKLELSALNREFYIDHFNFRFVDNLTSSFTEELCAQFLKNEKPEEPIQKKNIFISFDPKDESFLQDLMNNLSPFEQNDWARLWHRGLVDAGDDEQTAIQLELQQADIILLLVSSDFLGNELLFAQEVQVSLDRAKKKVATVVPIIIRSSSWELAAYGNLFALPDNKVPVNSKDWGSSDYAYKNIVEGIKKMLF